MYYTPSMLAGWLKNCTTQTHIGTSYPVLSGGIILLNDWYDTLKPNCLYLGSPDVIEDALNRKLIKDQSYMFICAGDSLTLHARKLPDHISLITTNLSLIDLYNKTQYHVHKFLDWDHKLQHSIMKNEGYQTILDQAYEGMNTTILLLNAGYKVLAACYHPEVRDDIIEEVQAHGYLSFETVKRISKHLELVSRSASSIQYLEYQTPENNLNTIIWPLEYKKTVVGHLIVLINSSMPTPNYVDLSRILLKYLEQYTVSGKSAAYGGNASFGSLVSDILEFRLTDPDEIKERLQAVPLMIQKQYHMLIVSFGSSGSTDGSGGNPYNSQEEQQNTSTNIPWNYVVSQLQLIFPFSNITIYHQEILILVRKSNSSSRCQFNEDALNRILSYYNGYAGVGNYSRFLSTLPYLYDQTKAGIRLGVTMNHDPQKRIFRYEDYAIYHDIELCIFGMREKTGLTNFIYLCHPSLIGLIHYDRKHKSNLCQVLKVYLNTDQNAAEVSRKLYTHRNTILYKIQKIEEILGQPLDNPGFRTRLLYSFAVYEYMTDYLHRDILDIQKNAPVKSQET